MGFIGSLVGGTSGNAGGAGMRYQAQGIAPEQAVTPEQIKQAYEQSQFALADQQNFVNALNAQNGIQNQSDVYNMYNQIAQGTGGPNPAQAMLNQATSQNVANQAALMAGQRGAGQNVGMIARQAGMQGGSIEQQAAAQAAIMRAQQQQAAMGQMAGIAGQQVGQQAGAIQNYNQAAQNEQQNLLGAVAGYNQANVAQQGNQNMANAGVASKVAEQQGNLIGGAIGGVGSALPAMAAYDGGEVKGYADGGDVPQYGDMSYGQQPAGGPKSFAGKFLSGYAANDGMSKSPIQSGMTQFGAGIGSVLSNLFKPSNEPTENIGSPIAGDQGEKMSMPVDSMNAAKGGVIHGESFAAKGKMIPGKAKVQGDSLKNDNVPAILSPGEIILPRSVAQHPEAPKKAAEFVAAIMAKKRHGGKSKK